MAPDRDKRKGGRVTPKGGQNAPSSGGPQARRGGMPARIGPFAKPDKNAPLGQVGRRPTSPGRLYVLAAVYFVCGVASFFVLKGSLKVIIGVVFIGLSLLWLRGAATAQLRRTNRDEDEG